VQSKKGVGKLTNTRIEEPRMRPAFATHKKESKRKKKLMNTKGHHNQNKMLSKNPNFSGATLIQLSKGP
jgi:hypothetical protein